MRALLLVAALACFGCSKSGGSSGDSGATQNANVTAQSVHYFKAVPNGAGQATTVYNLTVDFTNYNTTLAGWIATDSAAGATCYKSGAMSSNQAVQLFNLVSAMTITQATANGNPANGVEYIEITTTDGVTSKYNLFQGSAQVNEYYAISGGVSVSSFLSNFDLSLPQACQ